MSDKPYMHFIAREEKFGLVTLVQTGCFLVGYEAVGKSFTCVFKSYEPFDRRAIVEVHTPFVGYSKRFEASRVVHHISCPLCRESEAFKAKNGEVQKNRAILGDLK